VGPRWLRLRAQAGRWGLQVSGTGTGVRDGPRPTRATARERGGSWASCCALLGQKEMEPTQAKGKAFFLFKKDLNQNFQHLY